MPIDADEFWTAPATLADALARHRDAGAVRCDVANFVQRRDQYRAKPTGLAGMTMRARPAGSSADIPELVASRRLGFVQTRYPQKYIARASPDLAFAAGNHLATGLTGPTVDARGIVCLHAPLRAREVLRRRADIARRLDEAGRAPHEGWHIRRWGEMGLTEAETLDLEWAANSHLDGVLDVYGVPHELVGDPRLRDAAAPWIRPAWKQTLARIARRSY